MPNPRANSLTVQMKDGLPSLLMAKETLIESLELYVGCGWGFYAESSTNQKKKITHEKGWDSYGNFELTRCSYVWRPEPYVWGPQKKEIMRFGLAIKTYTVQCAAVVWLEYDQGPALSGTKAARVNIKALPGFSKGLSMWRHSQFWTSPYFINDPSEVHDPTQYLLWQRGAGNYGVMIPLGGDGAKATLNCDDIWVGQRRFGTVLNSFSPDYKPKRIPVFAVAFGQDPYLITDEVYSLASSALEKSFKLRAEKPYPQVFEGLGWCSWNVYYGQVNAAKLKASAASFGKAKFPLQYMIIDDGWYPTKDGKMLDFDADRKKFPEGLGVTVTDMKRLSGAGTVGVWHAFQGYWKGIHPASSIAKKFKSALWRGKDGVLIPNPLDGKGQAFYAAWYVRLKAQGIGILKVDNQASVQFTAEGHIPLQQAAQGQEANMQQAASVCFGDAVVNCMSMSSENIYTSYLTNITRNSEDYFQDVHPTNARTLLWQNVYNALWVSRIAYPDFDMFESHHPYAEAHALLRAVSGGPVYVTDTVGREQWPLLWKLITADGRLLRADQPAQPTRDMLFKDPLTEAVALKTFTRADRAGVVAVFNVYRDGKSIQGTVKAADVEGIEGESFLVYEHFSGKSVITRRQQAIRFTLPVWGKALYTFVPLSEGFAAVGLLDKFLSARAVEGVVHGDGFISVRLREAGRFGFYSTRQPRTIRPSEGTVRVISRQDGSTVVDFQGKRPQGGVVLNFGF